MNFYLILLTSGDFTLGICHYIIVTARDYDIFTAKKKIVFDCVYRHSNYYSAIEILATAREIYLSYKYKYARFNEATNFTYI